ncbi:MAG: sugar ABC transporter substrate-binding protein, partial [Verrucomicrobia bacterium]|nr:sugar ABC transporter substrate-binding protein [Verrucomicrobiota bacterium]
MRNLRKILILSSLLAAAIQARAVTEITYWLWDNNQLPAYQACAAA